MDISLLLMLMAALSQADADCGSYNIVTHICCETTLHPTNGIHSLRCCGHDFYDKSKGLRCCNDVVGSIAGMRNPSCCGTTTYDRAMSKCFSGSVYVKLGNQPKCCGHTIFDASFFQCCSDGQVRFNCDSSPIPITAKCPSGFQKLEENCYAFQNDRKPYQEAKEACIAMGAFLIEPRSEAQNNFTKYMLNANNAKYIWLGANDLNNEGEFVWETSGGLVSDGYTDWNPTQPDNWRDKEHCMELAAEIGQWNDQQCKNKKLFICQTPLDIPSTTTQQTTTTIEPAATPTLTANLSNPAEGDTIVLTCATTSSGITDYTFVFGQTAWGSASPTSTINSATIGTDDGSYTCIAYIGTVASDPSNAHIVSLTPQKPTLSVSPSDATIESGTSLTLTCATASIGTTTYTFMKNNHIITRGSSSSYVSTSSSGTFTYSCMVTINTVDSIASNGHTRTIVDTCPSGFEKKNDNCYGLQEHRKNYQDARDACIAINAFLAEPSSEEENTFLKSMVNTNRKPSCWLGADDQDTEGVFVWRSSGKLVSEGYTDWGPQQPDNWKNREHCMELDVRFSNWNDQRCRNSKHYICQIRLEQSTTQAPTTQPSTPSTTAGRPG